MADADKMVSDNKDTGPYGVDVWRSELKRARKAFEPWEKKGDRILKIYKDERSEANTEARYNVLWSIVQTMRPSVFAQLPKPVVQRRYLDRDPVGRMGSQILQRCLQYEVESGTFAPTMSLSVEDYLLVARGAAWVRYEPTIEAELVMGPDGLPVTGEDGEPLTEEKITRESVEVDHVNRKDFLHSPARHWGEVRWVARRSYLNRDEGTERFGDKFKDVPLNVGPEGKIEEGKQYEGEAPEELRRAVVWEIWCKDTRKAHWIADDFDEFLDEQDDPLHLEDFFPCPKPIYGTLTNDSLVPVPDYVLWQSQAEEINELTARIDALTAALKVVGVFDNANASLSKLLSANDGSMIPVENWVALASGGGLKGVIDWLPIEVVSGVLERLYMAREQARQGLYEISGIGDILRGQGDPNETATAQRIKGQFGTQRLQARQAEVARFARDILRIAGEIVAEHYQPETIRTMSGVDEMVDMNDQVAVQRFEQEFQAAIQLLKDEKTRGFRVEIETDSTIAPDEQAEKEASVEMLTAVGSYLQQAMAAAQQVPALGPMLLKMLLFGVRRFKVGRELESTIEDFAAQMEQQAEQPPPPSPEMQKVEAEKESNAAKMEMESQKLQLEASFKQQEHDMEMRSREMDLQFKERELQMKHDQATQDFALKSEIERSTLENTRDMDRQKFEASKKPKQEMALAEDDAIAQRLLEMGEQNGAAMQQLIEGIGQLGQFIAQSTEATTAAISKIAKVVSAETEIFRDPATGAKRARKVLNGNG